MGSQLKIETVVSLYETLGCDKPFVESLAKVYKAQGEEFMTAAADRVDVEILADLAHRLAGSTSRLEVPEFIEATLTLEAKLRSGNAYENELDAVLTALPAIMSGFAAAAQELPDNLT